MSILNPPRNPNYAASVVKLENFRDLAGCDNVKAALIYGNQIIVGKGVKAGDVGLFFPVETQILRDFLANNNLFRKPEWGNMDPEKKGFFEEHGRVKAVKFRGHKSEGFWIPLESLSYLGVPLSEFPVGAEFDSVGDRMICQKYVPRHRSRVGSGAKTEKKAKRVEDQIVDGQFQFHIDTENLRRNIHKITPDMWISLSDKWHGTSAIYANVLVNRPLKWWEKALRFIGLQYEPREHGYVWSSRRVVKGVNGEAKANAVHYYTSDIWGTVAKEVEFAVPKGYTLYGEIVGYTEDGSAIQKGYHYGCQPGTHRFLVYRVTQVNDDGITTELSWQQMKQFCERYGLEMVKELWYGRAGDWPFHPYVHVEEIDTNENVKTWQEGFLEALERIYVRDQMCVHNNCEVPAEGIVLRVDTMYDCIAFKLKSFRFLEWETKQLDAGTVDIETAESADEETAEV
jgi:hypothetical protein